MTPPRYENRQFAPFFSFVSLIAAGGCYLGARALEAVDAEYSAMISCDIGAGFFVVTAFVFMWLETIDEGDHLLVRFGPLPIARRRVAYDRIKAVRRDRSTLLEGWGIHLGTRGWIWNLWGREVVELDLDKGRLRIGTNDPEGLAAFLRTRCDLD